MRSYFSPVAEVRVTGFVPELSVRAHPLSGLGHQRRLAESASHGSEAAATVSAAGYSGRMVERERERE